MDELIKMVSGKAGNSEDQARTAVNETVNFLKQKLPAPVASQIDAVMSGNLGNLASGLGGMFGKK
jgi:nucleoid DNA-binding protein